MNKDAPVDIMPERIHQYLTGRGLNDEVLARNHITWDGERIVIPIFDKDGLWLFNKYRRDPDSTIGPKYTYDTGAHSALYGADKIAAATKIIVCEGEFDALILEAQGFVGVSSTGGAGTFKEEWAGEFEGKEMYACFDNDPAGEKGRIKLAKLIPGIKQVPIPFEVGSHGDITDFFIKLGKTKKNFETLMEVSQVYEVPKEPVAPKRRPYGNDGEKTERLKAAKEVPLSTILKFNNQKFARCPFHEDKTPSLHQFGANRWKCFSCDTHGDSIDLVMRMQNISMKAAIDFLLKS